MPFTVNMSGSVAVDNSLKTDYETDFIIEYEQLNVMDPFVEFHRQMGAKSISFPRYALLGLATTPLTELDDVTSSAMSDTEILLTPAEYGNVITTTSLADLQSGGRLSRGAVALVAKNMAETRNALATAALEASSNVVYGGDATSTATIDAADVMDGALLNKIYNKLRRSNVPMIDGHYVAFMHDDVIHDLRAGSAAGTWMDVNKYNNELPVLNNEVGMFRGFRIICNNHSALAADAGATTTDVYTSSFLGANGLGLAESMVPELRVTGPFDKLGRFVNVGWYGVFQYKIIESSAVWTAETASSVGANA